MDEKLVKGLTIITVALIVILIIEKLVSWINNKISRYKNRKNYLNSSYYKITKLPIDIVKNNLGYYGEYLIFRNLKRFEDNGAKFLFNLYLPTEDDKTTEIDALMICSKGIFVFESKNFSGWIFGDEANPTWYQTLPSGSGKSNKESFYNPIMQNRRHIGFLKTLLDLKCPIWSIVVFSDRCELKNIKINSKESSVINLSDVFNLVDSVCEKQSGVNLDEKEINEIYCHLYPYSQVDGKTRIEHTFSLNPSLLPEPVSDNIAENESLNNALVCPSCGGKLVIRTAKKGINAGNQFYGCSNYPKCRYTRNIEL